MVCWQRPATAAVCERPERECLSGLQHRGPDETAPDMPPLEFIAKTVIADLVEMPQTSGNGLMESLCVRRLQLHHWRYRPRKETSVDYYLDERKVSPRLQEFIAEEYRSRHSDASVHGGRQ